jgi:hypothetical protein
MYEHKITEQDIQAKLDLDNAVPGNTDRQRHHRLHEPE